MIGTRLGPYRLLKDLGAGGMGRVYLAEAVGATRELAPGTWVALKLLHAHLVRERSLLARFFREAAIGQAVRHPNVVETLAAGVLASSGEHFHYLTMEYVEGQTLRGLLGELGRVPEELCRHIGREVAKGLGAIHAAGAIHRDLKPENILITRDHAVKIMDFGVARLNDERSGSQSQAFAGSLLYAAPEQLDGDRPLDGRVDLHALGLVLYELASGAHPFHGDDPGADLPGLVHRLARNEPRRLAERSPHVSALFDEVVHTLLAKEPEGRLSSAAELCEILERGEASPWWRSRARAIRREPGLPHRRAEGPEETALHGRDAEMARLRSLYHLARAASGQAVLIEGEAGVGKTRLVEELVTRLRDEGEKVNFLFGSYWPGGAAGAGEAFSAAYLAHFGNEGLEETLHAHLHATPLLVPAFAAHLRGQAAPAGVLPLTPETLATTFVQVTRALAAERPTVVAIDDLHFAPEEGRRLFLAMARAMAENRVLLIATARPGLPDGWLGDLERLGNSALVRPGRLAGPDVARLLADALGSETLAQDLERLVVHKSDGNPYFIFEILRVMEEAEFIARAPDGAWVRRRDIRDLEAPSSVTELIEARVTLLDSEERSLLEVAACCGFEFDPHLVGEALGLGSIPTIKRFDRLEQVHHLVRVAGTRYTFDHHLVQEVLYGALPEDSRRRHHGALAEALAARSGRPDRDPLRSPEAIALQLCDHELRSSRPESALPHLEPALAQLQGRNLGEPAIRLGERALGIPGLLTGEKRLAVLLRLVEAFNQLGWREKQEATIAEATREAQATGSPYWLARARKAAAIFFLLRSHYEEAREQLGQALAHARDARDMEEESLIVNAMATLHWYTGEYEQARALYERVLADCERAGNRARVATAIGNLGLVSWNLGRLEEALTYHERHLALSREIGDLAGEHRAYTNMGNVQGELGRHAEAMECQRRAIALARDLGNPLGEAIATGNLADLYFALARFDDARTHILRHLAISRQIGYQAGEAVALANLGALHLALGDPDRARTWLVASGDLCAEIGARRGRGISWRLLAECHAACGEMDLAEGMMRDALALQREIGYRRGVAETLVASGRLAMITGRTGEARERLEEGLAVAREIGAAGQLVLAAAYLAALPEGDVSAACDAYATHEARLDLVTRMETLFHLWSATRDSLLLAQAYDLLEHARKNAPAECRETMLTGVPLHREIQAAWAARGR